MNKPSIAVITPDTLAAIGISALIKQLMPMAEIATFAHYADLESVGEEADTFFHYFVSVDEIMNGAKFFLRRQHKTIVLVHGITSPHLPQGFHTLNVYQEKTALIRSILQLAQSSHAHPQPNGHFTINREADSAPAVRLTPREIEVLKGIVEGLINKEIAERMGISVATVITHRNHLTEKLGTRSVSSLTIFAIMHGFVKGELI